MGKVIDTVVATATAPGASFTAMVTTLSGDSLSIRNADLSKPVWLLSMIGFVNVAGQIRIRSPKLHDARNGIQYFTRASDPMPLFPFERYQRLYPQDTLVAEVIGSAVGGQIETLIMQVLYTDIPGGNAPFIDENMLNQLSMNDMPQPVAHTAAVTGAYTNPLSLNVTQDNFKANTPYAVIGAEFDVTCGGATLRGPDTGNYRIFVPGLATNRWMSANWFIRLSAMLNQPLIPVIFSPNKANTISEVIQTQAGGAINVTWNLVELNTSFKMGQGM